MSHPRSGRSRSIQLLRLWHEGRSEAALPQQLAGLEGGPGGGVARSVNVLSIRVSRADGAVLMEARQCFPDGRQRQREGTYVAEKLLPGEAWQDGVRRAVQDGDGHSGPLRARRRRLL